MTDTLANLLGNVSNVINEKPDELSDADFVKSVRVELEKVKLYLQWNPSVYNLILINPETLKNLESKNAALTEMCLTFKMTPEMIREFLEEVNDVVQEFTYPAAVSFVAL